MHQLSVVSLWAVLFNLEIQNTCIYMLLGLVISFIGPIAATWIMKKNKFVKNK